jgi:hypothetical protein
VFRRKLETSDLKPYQRLQLFWHYSDSDMAVCESDEAEVRSLEEKYCVRFPTDFREYLRHSCPQHEENWDAMGTYWWPAAQIKNSLDYCYPIGGGVAVDPAKCIFFADYLAECQCWAIDCGEGKNRGRVVVDGSRFVADSFTQFVALYIQDYVRDGNQVF